MNKKLLRKQLIDSNSNKRVIGLMTYIIAAIVAFVMTIMNIITDKGTLTYVTALFCIVTIMNIFIAYFGKSLGRKIAAIIFGTEIVVMITYFIVSGSPEGFSAIWACLVPALAMLFYDLIAGSILSGILFLDLAFFFWTPLGQSFLQYQYTETFKMRFPILYLSYFALVFVLQLIQSITWDELSKLNKMNEEQAEHDQLTKLYNRQGIIQIVDEWLKEADKSVGVVMVDIDYFKRVNDTFGHTAGDVVLVKTAQILKNALNGKTCRWGGEEFAIFFTNDNVTSDDLENVRIQIQNTSVEVDNLNINVTVSMGVYTCPPNEPKTLKEIIQLADQALYESKNKGRNRVTYYECKALKNIFDNGPSND